jgi:hypothetical protein
MGSKAMRKELPGGEFVEAKYLRCVVSSPVLTYCWSGLAFEVVQFGDHRAAAAQLGRYYAFDVVGGLPRLEPREQSIIGHDMPR